MSLRSLAFSIALLFSAAFLASAAEDRIRDRVDNARTVVLKGHVHPNAIPQNDRGALDSNTGIDYVTVMLRPDASLDGFLARLQTPGSAEYHRWLTPQQFGDRFGVSQNDADKLVQWMRSQGLQVHDVARGRHWITFSGTADRVGRALHTSFRRYAVDGKMHFANASDPAVPAAFESVVSGIEGLNDFGDKPNSIVQKTYPADSPALNSGANHFMAPDDFATIYNLTPLYAAGLDGSGQKIAVIGQTRIDPTDITAFRNRFHLPPNDPQMVLMGRDPGITGDITEADLDVEWTGAVARNATIYYVYSTSVRISVQYAVDQNIAPVMTYSYSSCERSNTPAFRAIAQQAAAQGITWMVSSGDTGSAECDRNVPTPLATHGPTVNFFAAFPEVTGVGGTMFDESAGKYWASSNDANFSSALSYIPERVWNEADLFQDLVAGGSGPSALFSKPVWQTGPGVPDDKARDVPDVSLASGVNHDGYEVTSQKQVYIIGGTSAATPAFAGLVAILNQSLVRQGLIPEAGLGNINPMLYRLAQSTKDVFHDITSGDNMVPCVQSSPMCVNGLLGYAAATGYDVATGLGSVDANNLVTKWNIGASATVSLTSSAATVDPGGSVQITATVIGSGKTTPTGAVTFQVNDTLLGNVSLAPGTASATAMAVISAPGVRIAMGDGTVTALYNGDAVFNPGGARIKVGLNLPASGSVVIPSISPNPVYQTGATSWPYTVSLTEINGVGTKLTGFTINGADNSANIASLGGGNIAAKGTVSVSLVGNVSGNTLPFDRTFVFSGADADGTKWSTQITVPFAGVPAPLLTPSFSLTANPSKIEQNPQADASCQWSTMVTVQESAGYAMLLTGLTTANESFSSQLQNIFGTTRLAPYGSLRGRLCWASVPAGAARTLTVAGTAIETGAAVILSTSLTLNAPAASAAALTVAQSNVGLAIDDASKTASSSLDLAFAGGSPSWTASVVTQNGGWLTLNPISGTGAGKVTLQAGGSGLSPGAYLATVSIEAPGSIPQYISIPVTLTVGKAGTTTISGVANGASFKPAFAPGELISVFGTNLARSTASAQFVPLPMSMSGVSATVNGIAAPLFYISPGQLNVQIPYDAGSGPAILAVNNGGQIASTTFQIDVAAPGLFGMWDALGLPAAKAQQGQVLIAFITGEGDETPYVPSGNSAASGTAISRLPKARLPLTVTVGGVQADVAFSGIPSGLVGVTQINFTVPLSVPVGPQPVVMTVGGVASNTVTLNVTAAN